MRSALVAVALVSAFAVAVVIRSATPDIIQHPGCGETCSSNFECNSSGHSSCPYCSFGVCRQDPPNLLPVDAGVDAP